MENILLSDGEESDENTDKDRLLYIYICHLIKLILVNQKNL